MERTNMRDLIIIGAGPAGLSAAIYAKRAALNTLVIEKNPLSGGQIMNTYEVDNYLGLPNIGGFEMASRFREHADLLNCEFLTAEVSKITKIDEKDNPYFIIKTNIDEIAARSVIIAAGASHAKLGVPGETELAGMGVSYCATCDGAFFRGRTVAVIGGGDVAAEDAIFLARACEKVYLIHRRNELRAAAILIEALQKLNNVEILWDTVVEGIDGEDQVEAVKLRNVNTNVITSLNVAGIFIAVGLVPNTKIFQNIAPINEKGYFIADENCVTGTSGIFAAGDIRTKKLRQITTAVADGAIAVTSVQQYLLDFPMK
ncbi:MAG: thioredoxin-disulfide reductase [Lachnospiraceae bacterium]|nr:thioredoxin-disulfide reductase [Lachnospiraceae bacterium]